jgi:hypothetical protein
MADHGGGQSISPPPSPPPVQLVCAEMTGTHTMALIGRDANGDSVAVLVDNVCAYLWVRVPEAWVRDHDGTLNKTIWESFISNLNDEASDKIKSRNAAAAANARTGGMGVARFCVPPWILKKMGSNGKDRTINVINPSLSDASEARRFSRFHGYDAARHLFGRVALTAPDAMRVVVGLLEHPTTWMRRRMSHRTQTTFELAEATLAVTTQACADMGLTPGGWFSLRAGITPAPQGVVRVHHTYTNVDAADVVPLADRTGLAPLKVLSFDIEVYTKDLGHGAVRFFDGDDPAGKCLCIAACTLVVGRPEVQRVVFAIDPDSPEPRDETVPAVSGDGAVVLIRWLPDETQLLLEFSQHLRDSDADFVTGWNTDRFDFGWLALAAKRLGIDKDFWDFSRFKFQKAFYNTKMKNDTKKKVILKLPGRVPYDLMTWFKKNYQLPDYKLASVAEIYGCGSKDDVAYFEIGELFKTPAGRLKLALYCEQDTALVLKLVSNTKLDPVGKDMALCSITGVWPTDLLGRGTQNTLRCKMLRVAHARGFVLPHVPGLNKDDDDDVPVGAEADGEEEDDNGYQVRPHPQPADVSRTQLTCRKRAARCSPRRAAATRTPSPFLILPVFIQAVWKSKTFVKAAS